jgi:hypothetical protein
LKASWYIRRLSAMSPPEIGHRIIEQCKRLAWRRQEASWDWFDIGDGDLPVVPGLRERLRREPRKDVLEACRTIAEAVRSGQFSALGVVWPVKMWREESAFRDRIWHLDPVTGEHWPGREAYCFDVRYRYTTDRGDVKYVWELNRLQFLQPAAVAVLLSDQPELLTWIEKTIESWHRANPPFRGVNWCSGIELALRVISFVFIASCLQDRLNKNTRRLLRRLCVAHAFWIDRYPSLYSSANNHLVAEGVALFVLGALLADMPKASVYESKGRNICEREIQLQILPDGVGAEQSPTYAAFTLELLLLAALVARSSGRDFSSAFYERMQRAAEHFSWIIDQGGHAPAIGDNDEGRVIVGGRTEEPRYPASILACLAGWLGAHDLAPLARDGHLRELVFGASPSPGHDHLGVRHFRHGGYTVARCHVGLEVLHLVFDHGPLGYLSIAAHGHADALSFWLSRGGKQLLVDSGTFLYHSGGAWRDHFRGTAAHNTLTVGGRDQSQIAGPFSWSHKAVSRLDFVEKTVKGWRIGASHDGYEQDLGICHHRTLELLAEEIIVIDQLSGAPAPVEVGFLFDPNLSLELSESWVLVNRGADLVMKVFCDPILKWELARGGELDGSVAWQSPSFGVKVPAWRLKGVGLLEGVALRTRLIFE